MDVLWVSNNGAISFNAVDDDNLESISSNFVIAPLWGSASDGSVPSSGKVFYRTLSNSADKQEIADDINQNENMQSLGSFNVHDAFMATYKNVQNPLNSDQKNQYQVVVAKGTIGNSATEKTVVVFNYHMLDWVPDSANLGIFAAADESERCHAHLKDDNNNLVTTADLLTGSNVESPGKWVMIHSTDVECQDMFETECPVAEQGSRATLSGMMSLMGNDNPDNWEFYAFHQCIPGHEVAANIDTVRATCL